MRPAFMLALAAAALALLAPGGPVRAQQHPEPLGMVSLRITVQEFDPSVPWNKKPERIVLGNALVVRKGLLLTTADLVKNATLVEVRKFGRYPDYPATTLLLDHELDLALLEVASEEFWVGLTPLPFSVQPVGSGRFDINRWRPNGRFEQGSGEVVELQVATSRYGNLEFPELRASTAMSGLGWGEVLTNDGQVIGLVTSHGREGLQATLSPLLQLFIEAAQRKPYRGFAHRGFAWQQLNHAALRRYHGLEPNAPGVLVRRVLGGGTGSGQLERGDILLKLGPHVIDPEGHILHPLYGPILFTISMNESLDDTIPALVVRDGKEMQLALQRRLFTDADYRIHPYRFDEPIEFDMFGGLVLQELSLGFLRLWGKNWQDQAPSRLVMEYYLNSLREADEPPGKLVVISRVLPDPANIGYDGVASAFVRKVNGKPVHSLADFRAALRSPQAGFHVLELNPGGGRGRLVFKAAEMEGVNRRVRERYGVPEPEQKAMARGAGAEAGPVATAREGVARMAQGAPAAR